MTIDGTDCQIRKYFNKGYYSFKFKGPGLRYEVGVCIQTGDICWVNGPYKCGSWPDISIFRDVLKGLLLPRELVEADAGYRGDAKCSIPTNARNTAEYSKKKDARSRHETINGYLKKWGVLHRVYCHDLNNHGRCFMAVAVLTQLTFERGARPYQVNY